MKIAFASIRITFVALLMLFWVPDLAKANPNFLRKYKLDCATCHTVAPQLTRTGLEFRRLGYRFPNEFKATPEASVPSKDQASSAKGQEALQAMEKADCMQCHSVANRGSGKTLEGVGAKMDKSQIIAFITNDDHPGAEQGKALSPEAIEMVVIYLSNLREDTNEKKSAWDYNMADYISVRGRSRWQLQKTEGSDANHEFRYNDMTSYYLGPVNKYLTVFWETEFEEGFEPNVLAQGTLFYGNADRFGYIKVGHMRLVRQGVGPLDRPKTISTDLAVSGRSHLFALNTDQRGVELGYGFNQNRTLIRVFVMNGISASGSGRPVGDQDANNQKDIAVIAENLFGQKTATAISGVYYRGFTPASQGNIEFERIGLVSSLALNTANNYEDIRLNGGVLLGYDDVPGTKANDRNLGFLVGIDKRLGNQFYVSTRYDQFRPTDRVDDNITRSYTLGIIKQVLTFIRLSAEYQRFERPNSVSENRIVSEFFLFF